MDGIHGVGIVWKVGRGLEQCMRKLYQQVEEKKKSQIKGFCCKILLTDKEHNNSHLNLQRELIMFQVSVVASLVC